MLNLVQNKNLHRNFNKLSLKHQSYSSKSRKLDAFEQEVRNVTAHMTRHHHTGVQVNAMPVFFAQRKVSDASQGTADTN